MVVPLLAELGSAADAEDVDVAEQQQVVERFLTALTSSDVQELGGDRHNQAPLSVERLCTCTTRW